MLETSLIVTALLFGGTVLYSFGFAAFVFNALPADVAGPLIRRAFPHFYVFVLATSVVAAGFAAAGDLISAVLLAAIAGTTVFARQVLMPRINAATDRGDKRQFKLLHTVSVVITMAHIVMALWVLLRLAQSI